MSQRHCHKCPWISPPVSGTRSTHVPQISMLFPTVCAIILYAQHFRLTLSKLTALKNTMSLQYSRYARLLRRLHTGRPPLGKIPSDPRANLLYICGSATENHTPESWHIRCTSQFFQSISYYCVFIFINSTCLYKRVDTMYHQGLYRAPSVRGGDTEDVRTDEILIK